MCPPPDAKAKKSAEYVESKGVLAEKYDVLLHFAIAHMRRVDGALPPHSSGRKAPDLLAKEGEHRWSLFPPCGALHNVSLHHLQVLHPFSSTDLWLLVLLHVGERGRPRSGGY